MFGFTKQFPEIAKTLAYGVACRASNNTGKDMTSVMKQLAAFLSPDSYWGSNDKSFDKYIPGLMEECGELITEIQGRLREIDLEDRNQVAGVINLVMERMHHIQTIMKDGD